MVQIVDRETVSPPRDQGVDLGVGPVEPVRETAEEIRHPQFSFRPTEVAGRVDQAGLAAWTDQDVARPKVSVDQAGRLVGHKLRQASGDGFHTPGIAGLEQAGLQSEFRLELQSMPPEEVPAISGPRIRLWRASQVVVMIETEAATDLPVEPGQLPSEPLPGIGLFGGGREVFQKEERFAPQMGLRNPRPTVHSQGGQALRLTLEKIRRDFVVDLEEESVPAGRRQS